MEEDRRLPDPPAWFKWLPIVSIILSVIMLLFQIFVLHGWHMKLSNQMRHIKGKF